MAETVKRILLVEDDEDLQKKLKEFLTSRGYQVDLARDGNEAILKGRELSPHLILLDAVLPKMNGFHVARLLKFDPRSKRIPIVMITILDRPADQKKGKDVGVDLYLIKPVSEELLLKAIQQLIH